MLIIWPRDLAARGVLDKLHGDRCFGRCFWGSFVLSHRQRSHE